MANQQTFYQMGLLDFDDDIKPFKIDKPIRLIELFAGIGAQAKALENLGVNFEHYKICEFDPYAIRSYNAVHKTNFETSDITKITADDLSIIDTDKYCYIMTYSFPCQDLSLAGKQKGMKKGEGTRSGLLWEVERLLRELNQKGKNHLPKVLLLENVAQLLSYKNRLDFDDWCHFLSSLGYENYYKILNAKDFGIPQNRERCFMVSILGDGYYTFPKPKKLTICLKDMLEKEVDEKYFLSDKLISYFERHSKECEEKGNGFRFSPTNGNGIAKTITAATNNRMDDNFILIPETTKKGYAIAEEGDGIYINRPHQKRGVVQKDMIQTIKTSVDDIGVVVKDTKNEDTLKHQLCNELIESGLVKENDVIRHNYTDFKSKNNNIVVSNNECPTLDTRPDCLGVVVKDELIKVGEMTGGKWDKINESCRRVYDPDGIAPTLTTCGGGNQEPKIILKETAKDKRLQKLVSNTKFTMGEVKNLDLYNQKVGDISQTLTEPNHNSQRIFDGLRIRKLTPKECWRLMGFSDEDFDKAKKAGLSDSKLYKQAGNSIVVNVLMAIFKQML